MYTKRAVRWDGGKFGAGIPYLECECGNTVSLAAFHIAGMPCAGVECLCGITYDSRGFILSRENTKGDDDAR